MISRMRAATQTRYGGPDVVSVREVDVPVPGRGQVLVRVTAASLNAADLLAISGSPLFVRFGSGLFRPRHPVPGTDVAGTIEAVGDDVYEVAPGDGVVGDLSATGRGAFAEFVVTRPDVLVKLPDGADAAAAASVPMAAVTAYQALVVTAHLAPDETVLVDGASGGVGTFAVQLAKATGAKVTAICSEAKADIAREAGADVVLSRGAAISGGPFDVVYAVSGRHSMDEYDAVLAPAGRFVMTGGAGGLTGQVMLQGKRRERQTGRLHRFVTMKPSRDDLTDILEMMRDGRIHPIIDRQVALDDIMEGLTYMKAGNARGKVVITIDRSARAEHNTSGRNQ